MFWTSFYNDFTWTRFSKPKLAKAKAWSTKRREGQHARFETVTSVSTPHVNKVARCRSWKQYQFIFGRSRQTHPGTLPNKRYPPKDLRKAHMFTFFFAAAIFSFLAASAMAVCCARINGHDADCRSAPNIIL